MYDVITDDMRKKAIDKIIIEQRPKKKKFKINSQDFGDCLGCAVIGASIIYCLAPLI